MSISIEDLFAQKTAIEGFSIDPKESFERLKISRGYYANFSFATSIVNDKQYNIPFIESKEVDGKIKYFGPHEQIFESLIATKNRDLVQLAYKLKDYHLLRKKSDYDLDLDLTLNDIKNAETYFNECGDRMRFFVKDPTATYTKARKAIEVDMTSSRVKVSGLKIYD